MIVAKLSGIEMLVQIHPVKELFVRKETFGNSFQDVMLSHLMKEMQAHILSLINTILTEILSSFAEILASILQDTLISRIM